MSPPYDSNDPFAVLAHIRTDSPPTAEDIAKQAGSLPEMSWDEKDNFVLGVIEASDLGRSGSAIQTLIKDTVTNLSTLVLQADQALFSLEAKLGRAVDTCDRSQAHTLSAVLVQVKEVRKNFVRLIWESRNVAGKAEATVRDFGGDFLDYLSEELPKNKQEKKAEIQERSQEIRNYIKVLDRQREDMQDFADNVRGFPDSLKKCSDTFQVDTGVNDALKDLCSKVTSINSQIQGVHDALSKTPWATTVGGVDELLRVLLSGGSAYTSLGVVLPVAGHIKANTWSGLLASHGGALLQLYSKKETVLTEIENPQLDLTPIQAVQASLFTASERAKDSLKGLSLIVQALYIIRKELGPRVTALGNLVSNHQLPAYLQTKQSIYKALAEILRLYQIDVMLPQK